MERLLKVLTILAISTISSFAAGSWNGISPTAWNGIAFTSWNGTSIATGPTYTANTAVFDGSNDYMRHTDASGGANLVGLSDVERFTVSFWVNFSGGDGADQTIFHIANSIDGTPYFVIQRTSGNFIRFFARSSVNTVLLDARSTSTITASSGWTHIYACMDLASTSTMKVYINGVADTLVITTRVNDWINFHGASYVYSFGTTHSSSATEKLTAAVAEFWLNDSYLDDITKFRSGSKPIDLGATGNLPTGSAPVFYFKGNGNGFNVNSGTCPSFTITGSLGTTTPP
jgi:hypothetical protein